eukprot:2758946-Rhodomonas_salina.1
MGRAGTVQVTAGFGAALVGERGREQEAVAMVERALSIDPASRAALMAGVKVFGAAGHKEKAEKALRDAVRLRPWDWRLHAERARMMGVGGGGKEGALREAVRVAPWSAG